MGDIAIRLVEPRNRRHDLPDEADCGIDVEIQSPRRGACEQFRETEALQPVGYQTERGIPVDEPLHRPRLREVRMAELRKAAHAFAQRELEGRHLREIGADAQEFARDARRVGGAPTFAEAITKRRIVEMRYGGGRSVHGSPLACARTVPEPARGR